MTLVQRRTTKLQRHTNMAGLLRSSWLLARMANKGHIGNCFVKCHSRQLAISSRRFSEKQPTPTGSGDAHTSHFGTGDFHHPSDFEKRVLVWTKIYAKAEDIPQTVSFSKIQKAKDLFRIRVNLMMLLGTFLGCCLMIHTGRKARDSGDSLTKRGIEWQQKMHDQGERERSEAANTK